MDRTRIPPELLMGQAAPSMPEMGGPPIVDGITQEAPNRFQPPGPQMTGGPMGAGGGMGVQGPTDDLQSPLAPAVRPDDPSAQGGAQDGRDPVLDQLLARIEQDGPNERKMEAERRGKVPKPKIGDIESVAVRDKERHAQLIDRFTRDVALFRQDTSFLPNSFKKDREMAVPSTELSTLVNKISNMFAGVSQIYEIDYDNMEEEKSAQVIEDALYDFRKRAKRAYSRNIGGSLQRDEFWYLLLYGRYVKRILPDLGDRRNPWNDPLLDPATCFPTFGGGKRGMTRMVRVYEATAGEVVADYGHAIPNLERKIAKKMGYDNYSGASDWMDETGEVVEYWDTWWRYVSFRGEEIMPITAHELGEVPFVYEVVGGEPQGMASPGGAWVSYDNRTQSVVRYGSDSKHDMSQKGVSVFHYLVNTHKVKEMLMTIMYNEVEKATDPATITYRAPHLGGTEPPPLDTKRGGNNSRQLNMEQVEGIPTSPRPTDFAPLYQTLQEEMIQGSLAPGAFGAEQGSNVTGSGMDSMINNMKDFVMPYIVAWENGQAKEAEIKLNQYYNVISDSITLRVPNHDSNGKGDGEINDLTKFDIDAVGTTVDVHMTGMTMQNEAQMIAAMNQAVQAGFYSQRHAMTKLNVENPTRMLNEIITEKAMQHPEVMENFIIPEGLSAAGAEELMKMWLQIVVMPKMMMMQQSGGMPPGMGGPEGGGSQAAPNPLQGLEGMGGGPGGPPPGSGTGPNGPTGDPGMMI